MKPFSIGELARKTGIRTSALRYYEEAGILPLHHRTNGRRFYDGDAVRRVDVLRFAQQAGTGRDQSALSWLWVHNSVERTVAEIGSEQKLSELDVLAERIQLMRRALEIGLKCGCVRIEDCSLSPADATDEGQKKRQSKSCCA